MSAELPVERRHWGGGRLSLGARSPRTPNAFPKMTLITKRLTRKHVCLWSQLLPGLLSCPLIAITWQLCWGQLTLCICWDGGGADKMWWQVWTWSLMLLHGGGC